MPLSFTFETTLILPGLPGWMTAWWGMYQTLLFWHFDLSWTWVLYLFIMSCMNFVYSSWNFHIWSSSLGYAASFLPLPYCLENLYLDLPMVGEAYVFFLEHIFCSFFIFINLPSRIKISQLLSFKVEKLRSVKLAEHILCNIYSIPMLINSVSGAK